VLDILKPSNTAGGDNGKTAATSQFDGGVHVHARQHSITADIGIDDTQDTGIVHRPGQIDCIQIADLSPTVGRYPAIPRINTDNDALWTKADQCLVHDFRLSHGYRAQHHPTGTQRQGQRYIIQ